MDDGLTRSERDWSADRRDFVADQREQVADERDGDAQARDGVADDRDVLADRRERELNEWEQRLEARAEELGLEPLRPADETSRAADQRAQDAAERERAGGTRTGQEQGRVTASDERREATSRREAETPPTGLGMAFAEIATHLYGSQNIDEALETIASAAVSTLASCDMASITARDGETFRTMASTDSAATDIDKAQYAAGEGPCLDATEGTLVYAAEFPDARWPTLGSQPTDFGVRSIASFRVATLDRKLADTFLGSLNAYSRDREGFDPLSQEAGLILAAHASAALSALEDRIRLEGESLQLHSALETRDVIGQATGILMERLRLTPGQAFDVLRRASQHLNVKLRLVAEELTQTGELRDGPD